VVDFDLGSLFALEVRNLELLGLFEQWLLLLLTVRPVVIRLCIRQVFRVLLVFDLVSWILVDLTGLFLLLNLFFLNEVVEPCVLPLLGVFFDALGVVLFIVLLPSLSFNPGYFPVPVRQVLVFLFLIVVYLVELHVLFIIILHPGWQGLSSLPHMLHVVPIGFDFIVIL
jgi:hypothetical protein